MIVYNLSTHQNCCIYSQLYLRNSHQWNLWKEELFERMSGTGTNHTMETSNMSQYEAVDKLGKRMAYLLRYGAEKEGLKVSDGGYVDLEDLLAVPSMRFHRARDVIREVDTSVTPRGNTRFERKQENGRVYVRAMYGRRMERNPNHEGTKVPRLMEGCLVHICNNIKRYDLQEFPDEFLVTTIIHRLRTTHRLTNKAYDSLLGPYLQSLDLGGTMITSGTLRMVGQRCTGLKQLNLRESGYVLNDHLMETLVKKLPQLEDLNLSGCSHLGDRTINAIMKHCPNMAKLNISHVPDVTQDAVLKLTTTCSNLQHLDVFDNQNISEEGRRVLEEVYNQKRTVIILRGLDINKTDDTDSTSLKLASIGKFW